MLRAPLEKFCEPMSQQGQQLRLQRSWHLGFRERLQRVEQLWTDRFGLGVFMETGRAEESALARAPAPSLVHGGMAAGAAIQLRLEPGEPQDPNDEMRAQRGQRLAERCAFQRVLQQ